MSADIYTLKTGDLIADQQTEDQYDSLVANIYSCLNVELMQLLNQMLDNCDDALAVLSKNPETNDEEQAQKMTALRMLCHERSKISTNFFIALNESLKSSALHKADSNEEELTLVDQEEMEEMVAITTMHANALNLFGEEVSNLEARLEYLEIMSAVIFKKQAINPNRICELFGKALAPLEITTTNKLVLFKVFDEQVNLQLGNMYKTLNQLLIDADVLPEVVLKTQTYEEPEEEEVTTRTATYYDPSENKSTDFVPRSQSELNHIVSQFMKGTFTATGDELELPASFYKDPEKQNIDGKECYARKDVVKSLSRLQHKLTELGKKSDLVSADEIKRSLMADIEKNNKGDSDKEVNVLDERSIDFVGMMFNAITSDESISSVIKSLLMRLQIPVIKVAMSDEELFSNEKHPARNVLNLVTEAGKGVTEEDKLYEDIEEIVDEILHEYDIDIKSFDKAVDSLHELIKNEEANALENEKIGQREAIKAHARDVVLTELRGLSSNKKLPKSVQPLVLKHWSTLMLNRYINYGNDSNQWAQSVMLLKLMLKLLQPIKKKAQWHMLNNNHLALSESINDELYETRQEKDGIDEQIESLKNTFQEMLDNYGLKVVDDETEKNNEEVLEYTADTGVESNEAAIREKQLIIAKEKIAQLPSNVKPGVWFEIFNGENRAVRRLKMSTILTEVAKIIFVDRKGVKVIEKDVGEFVKELNGDKSRFIADHSTFDHALGKVISAMAA